MKKHYVPFLALGLLLQATLVANNQPQLQVDTDKHTLFLKDDEGNSVEIKADGSKVIKKTDGTLVEVRPDGSKHIIDAKDATSIEVKVDGTKIIQKKDGTIIEVKPDGTTNVKTNGLK